MSETRQPPSEPKKGTGLTRRRFLKLVGAGAAAATGLSSSNAIHDEVPHSPGIVHSPYYDIVYRELKREVEDRRLPPDKLKKGQEILEAIDQQGVDNYAIFNSEKFPNVAFPYSKVSMEKVLEQMPQATTQPLAATLPDQRKKPFMLFFPGAVLIYLMVTRSLLGILFMIGLLVSCLKQSMREKPVSLSLMYIFLVHQVLWAAKLQQNGLKV